MAVLPDNSVVRDHIRQVTHEVIDELARKEVDVANVGPACEIEAYSGPMGTVVLRRDQPEELVFGGKSSIDAPLADLEIDDEEVSDDDAPTRTDEFGNTISEPSSDEEDDGVDEDLSEFLGATPNTKGVHHHAAGRVREGLRCRENDIKRASTSHFVRCVDDKDWNVTVFDDGTTRTFAVNGGEPVPFPKGEKIFELVDNYILEGHAVPLDTNMFSISVMRRTRHVVLEPEYEHDGVCRPRISIDGGPWMYYDDAKGTLEFPTEGKVVNFTTGNRKSLVQTYVLIQNGRYDSRGFSSKSIAGGHRFKREVKAPGPGRPRPRAPGSKGNHARSDA
jgi:hypothetical protein